MDQPSTVGASELFLLSQTFRGNGGTVFVTCKQSKNCRLLFVALRDIYNSKDDFA
jgi:hypothetical protein